MIILEETTKAKKVVSSAENYTFLFSQDKALASAGDYHNNINIGCNNNTRGGRNNGRGGHGRERHNDRGEGRSQLQQQQWFPPINISHGYIHGNHGHLHNVHIR